MAKIKTEVDEITVSIPVNKAGIDRYCRQGIYKTAIDKFMSRKECTPFYLESGQTGRIPALS